MSGRGEGYCTIGMAVLKSKRWRAVKLPQSGQTADGYAGLQGAPVHFAAPVARPTLGSRFTHWLRPAARRGFGHGRGRRARW